MTGRSTVSHELLRQVKKFVEDHDRYWSGNSEHPQTIVTKLRAALAQPAVEPVAKPVKVWCEACDGTGRVHQEHQAGCWVGGEFACPDCDGAGYVTLIYAAPQPPAKVPLLTVDEQNEMMDNVIYKRWSLLDLVKNVEQAVRQKAGLV